MLGEAYVNNALKNVDDFNRPFQEMLTEYCWGAVWGREELPRKTRSMLNLAMISILNRPQSCARISRARGSETCCTRVTCRCDPVGISQPLLAIAN